MRGLKKASQSESIGESFVARSLRKRLVLTILLECCYSSYKQSSP